MTRFGTKPKNESHQMRNSRAVKQHSKFTRMPHEASQHCHQLEADEHNIRGATKCHREKCSQPEITKSK